MGRDYNLREYIKGEGLRGYIEKVIEPHDLKRRLPAGLASAIAKRTEKSIANVRKTILFIRRDRCVIVQTDQTVKPDKQNNNLDGILSILEAAEFFFNSPAKAAVIANTMIHILIYDWPEGGHTIMLGTPSALGVSLHPKYNKIVTSELEIATVAKHTSGSFTIFVGNGVNELKAKAKAYLWDLLGLTNNVDIMIENVTRDSFNHLITKAAEKHTIVKVILLTSGSWSGSKSSLDKLGIDVNFKAPAEYLTKRYPNLYILALVRTSKYVFSVRYLHNGINKIIK